MPLSTIAQPKLIYRHSQLRCHQRDQTEETGSSPSKNFHRQAGNLYNVHEIKTFNDVSNYFLTKNDDNCARFRPLPITTPIISYSLDLQIEFIVGAPRFSSPNILLISQRVQIQMKRRYLRCWL